MGKRQKEYEQVHIFWMTSSNHELRFGEAEFIEGSNKLPINNDGYFLKDAPWISVVQTEATMALNKMLSALRQSGKI